MRQNKYSKYLLSWLLALVMVLGVFSSTSVPVYASESTDDTSTDYKYSLEYQVTREIENSSGTYINYNSAVFYSDYRMFLVSNGYDYSNQGYRYYFLGYVVGDGTCNYATYDCDLDGTADFFLQSARFKQYNSSGELVIDKSYSDSKSNFDNNKKFMTLSEADYVCDGYVFESLAAATAFFETGDKSGLVREPDVIDDEDTPVDNSWKEIILEIIREWFGDTLEAIAGPLEAIANGISSTIETIVGIRDYIVANLPKRLSNALSTYFNNLDKSAVNIYTLFTGFYDFCKEKALESLSVINSIFEYTQDIAKLMVDITPDAFKEVFTTAFWDHVEFMAGKIDFLKEHVIDIGDFVSKMLEQSKTINTNLAGYINKFFDLGNWFLEGAFINDITEAFLSAFNDSWAKFVEPFEDLFIKLFVPDTDFIHTELTALRAKLGFIDDFQTAGTYLLNFLKNLGGGSPPVLTIALWQTKYTGAQTVTIDFSWYAPYKPTVDKLLAGMIYVTFIWNVFRRLPDIIQGAGMVSNSAASIENDIKS